MFMAITPARLEARVLELVDDVRLGKRIEDDLVECKSEWPDINKARQLAASANSARGNPILWLIGLDEDSGKLVPVDRTDPAEWWSRISARFDQEVSPTLTQHLRVPIGDSDSVIGLLFDTDRAPYVVKTKEGGSPEREVPVRDGTRTRSARRDELIRMLVPAAVAPPLVLLSAEVACNWQAAVQPQQGRHVGRAEHMAIFGDVSVYLEHTRGDVIVIPVHEMKGSLTFEDLCIPLNVTTPALNNTPPHWGVHTNYIGITCTAPGRASVRLTGEPMLEHRARLSTASEVRLSVALGVTGASRPIRLDVRLMRQEQKHPSFGEHHEDVGRWVAQV
jgi:hypothetical protein